MAVVSASPPANPFTLPTPSFQGILDPGAGGSGGTGGAAGQPGGGGAAGAAGNGGSRGLALVGDGSPGVNGVAGLSAVAGSAGSAGLDGTDGTQGTSAQPEVYGTSPIADADPPTAVLTAADVTNANAAAETPYTFTVQFQDDTFVVASSLPNAAVQVQPPSGPAINAQLMGTVLSGSTDGLGDASTITAPSPLLPPGGTWPEIADGTYTVTLPDTAVADLAGNAVPAGDLGTFQENVSVLPSSSVVALPSFSPASFTLNWSGSDNGGPGIASYTIFVSDNGGSFQAIPALTGTTQNSATYSGQPGHTYAFYSVATGIDSNVQPTPAGPQAQTTTAGYQYALSETANGTPTPVTIATVLSGNYSDPNGTPGIAIVELGSNGTWQFSSNGSTWTAIGSVSEAHALLLPQSDSLRFETAANFSGRADLFFLGWNGTQGTAGSFFYITSTGLASPFSAIAGDVAVTVNPVPLWVGSGAELTSILPGSYNIAIPATPAGNTVTAIFGPYFQDGNPAVSVSVAVSALTGTANGTWQYSIDAGSSWTAFPTISTSAALLLSSSDMIRFVPKTSTFAGVVTLTAFAWDGSTGTHGTTSKTNTTAFSPTTMTATATVNNAPALASPNGPTLKAITENATSAGVAVSSLLTTAGYSDPNGNGLSQGVAIVGVSANAPGSWQFMLSGGSWQALPAPSLSSALLLPSTASLRFVSTNQIGTATLSYLGWDQTQGTAGKSFDIAGQGGASAFSATSATASIVVRQAPSWSAGTGASFTSFLPGTYNVANAGTPAGNTVASVFGSFFQDIDPSKSVGVAVVGLTGTANGTWQFSTNGGSSWTSFSTVSSVAAVLLSTNDMIRFVPKTSTFAGVVTLTALAWDGTGSDGGTVNLSAAGSTGGATPFGATTLVASCTVNTAPVLSIASFDLPSVNESCRRPGVDRQYPADQCGLERCRWQDGSLRCGPYRHFRIGNLAMAQRHNLDCLAGDAVERGGLAVAQHGPGAVRAGRKSAIGNQWHRHIDLPRLGPDPGHLRQDLRHQRDRRRHGLQYLLGHGHGPGQFRQSRARLEERRWCLVHLGACPVRVESDAEPGRRHRGQRLRKCLQRHRSRYHGWYRRRRPYWNGRRHLAIFDERRHVVDFFPGDGRGQHERHRLAVGRQRCHSFPSQQDVFRNGVAHRPSLGRQLGDQWRCDPAERSKQRRHQRLQCCHPGRRVHREYGAGPGNDPVRLAECQRERRQLSSDSQHLADERGLERRRRQNGAIGDSHCRRRGLGNLAVAQRIDVDSSATGAFDFLRLAALEHGPIAVRAGRQSTGNNQRHRHADVSRLGSDAGEFRQDFRRRRHRRGHGAVKHGLCHGLDAGRFRQPRTDLDERHRCHVHLGACFVRVESSAEPGWRRGGERLWQRLQRRRSRHHDRHCRHRSDGKTDGSWQYSTTGGASWIAFPATVGAASNGTALLLSGSALVRFLPSQAFFGTVSLTVRAWDGGTGAATAGTIPLSTLSTGSTNHFSASTLTASCTVNTRRRC